MDARLLESAAHRVLLPVVVPVPLLISTEAKNIHLKKKTRHEWKTCQICRRKRADGPQPLIRVKIIQFKKKKSFNVFSLVIYNEHVIFLHTCHR